MGDTLSSGAAPPGRVRSRAETTVTSRDRPQAGIDAARPNVARMYDYFLGGKDNYAVDREAGNKVLAVLPEARTASWENREFLQRAVRFLAMRGVRQFIDIGCGLPTRGHVHEVAQDEAPSSRVVYVDYDPVVLAHARALLQKPGGPNVSVVEGDLREPEKIFADPAVQALIDFDKPVAVLVVAVLHFVSDAEDPHGIVDRIRTWLAPGSYLAMSHGTADSRPELVPPVTDVYQHVSSSIFARPRAEIARMLDGFELVDPGLAYVRQWRAESGTSDLDPEGSLSLGAVGRKA